MYHIFSIHSSVDGHLGCFHGSAIVNCACLYPQHGESICLSPAKALQSLLITTPSWYTQYICQGYRRPESSQRKYGKRGKSLPLAVLSDRRGKHSQPKACPPPRTGTVCGISRARGSNWLASWPFTHLNAVLLGMTKSSYIFFQGVNTTFKCCYKEVPVVAQW